MAKAGRDDHRQAGTDRQPQPPAAPAEDKSARHGRDQPRDEAAAPTDSRLRTAAAAAGDTARGPRRGRRPVRSIDDRRSRRVRTAVGVGLRDWSLKRPVRTRPSSCAVSIGGKLSPLAAHFHDRRGVVLQDRQFLAARAEPPHRLQHPLARPALDRVEHRQRFPARFLLLGHRRPQVTARVSDSTSWRKPLYCCWAASRSCSYCCWVALARRARIRPARLSRAAA